MLATVKGYYEKGKIILKENAPVQERTDVIVTFLSDIVNPVNSTYPGRISRQSVTP